MQSGKEGRTLDGGFKEGPNAQCIRRYVILADRKPRFLSNLRGINLFIAAIALHRVGNSVKKRFSAKQGRESFLFSLKLNELNDHSLRSCFLSVLFRIFNPKQIRMKLKRRITNSYIATIITNELMLIRENFTIIGRFQCTP